jgi:type IV secretion system protein VirD4
MTPLDAVFQLGLWGQTHTREVLAGAVLVPVAAGLAGVMRRRRHRAASQVMGSARWGTLREARQAGLMGGEGVVLGRLQGRLLVDGRETHGLLCGPTRSGKGVSHLIPTLRHLYRHQATSTLVLDPKDGENAAVTTESARQAGYHVALFTPCRPPQACLNVCDMIRLRTPQEFGDALTIAQSLTAPDKLQRESATSLHFRELASLLLAAGLLHVAYTSPRASLAALWHCFTQQHTSLAACLKTMARTAHTSHGVHTAIASMTTAISNITGDRELSSVWTTAIRPLVLYSDPLVARSTDTSTLRLEDLQHGTRPLALSLIAPSPLALERLHPVYRVIVDMAMTRLMERPVRTWQRRLFVCGDELPWYGYIRSIDKGLAVMAGYGIKALLVTQDLSSLEEVYGDTSAIWGNTDCKIFHAPAHDKTAKRLSEQMLGRGTETHAVLSRQTGMLGGRGSVSYPHVGRPLLMPDEVMELDPSQAIVRVTGRKPFLVQKVDYRTERF